MSGGMRRPDVLVVGIGNQDRGDDGFGPMVIRRLHGRAPPAVCILECSGDILALIEAWDGFAAVFVVDAAAPIGRPGRIHRLDLIDSALPVGFAHGSTHAFGIAETVELARSLGRLPSSIVAYLVEGEGFDNGAPLSPIVANAVDRVVECIVDELARISARVAAGAAEHA